MSRVRWMFGACSCLLVGCAFLWSGTMAQARIVHKFEKTFGSKGTGPGEFESPEGIAVNDVTHDVYVVDKGDNRVEEFDSSGTFIGEFNGTGAPTGTFSHPTQIAVDNSGNPSSEGEVYVVDQGHNVVDEFSASGTYLGQITGTTCELHKDQAAGEVIVCPKTGTLHKFTELEGVEVDPGGTVWVLEGKTYKEENNILRVSALDSFSDGQPNTPLTMHYTAPGTIGWKQFALDSEDDAYIAPGGSASVKVDSSGRELISPFCGTSRTNLTEPVLTFGTASAINQLLGQVFVAVSVTSSGSASGLAAEISVCGLDNEPVEKFGAGLLTQPNASFELAVDGSSSDLASDAVYVTDKEANHVVVFAGISLPTVNLTALSGQSPRGVTLNGTVNPEGRPVTSCVFEYDTVPYTTAASHGTSVPCVPGSVGSGSVDVPVSASITGLAPGTQYYYRLVAGNTGGVDETPGAEFFTGPVLGGEFVTEVTSGSATMNGAVDPNGDDSHYYFEYGTSASYGAFAPVQPPGVDLGSTSGSQPISVHLQGLQSGATFHYRLVVEQAGELFHEPDGTFSTQAVGSGTAGLPDGRVWELVSPANKGGALIGVAANLENPGLGEQAASDGHAIAYQADEPVGEGGGGRRVSSENIATHGSHGWSSRGITAPKALPPNGDLENDHLAVELFFVFSPDLSKAAFEPAELYAPLAEGVTERTDYIRDNLQETFEPLVTSSDVLPGTAITGTGGPEERPEEQMRIEAVTPDLSHVFLESPIAFTADAGPSGHNRRDVYGWSTGSLRFIGEGTIGGHGENFGAEMSQHAVSSDGRWVVIRQGQTDEGAKYEVVDTVEGTRVPFGGSAPHFETMSSDGSKVFYLETEGGGGHESNERGELYVLDPATGARSDLTATHLDGEASAGVQNTITASEDGSYVYFVATGVLAPGASSGADNLYVLHEENEQWSSPALIATLSREDRPDWRPASYANQADIRELESRVSPDGRYFAFMSDRSLTGYDNLDAVSGRPDEEIYLYDAGTQHLACVSCDPTGARPVGVHNAGTGAAGSPLIDRVGVWTSLDPGVDQWLAGVLPPAWYGGAGVDTFHYAGYQPRYLFDDGRVFFNSTDALVPQDTNGTTDVYEFEPPGVGSCSTDSPTFSARSGGCVDLISSGQSASESVFSDASESGDDVFFITSARLVPEDVDTSYDLYDAHACGTGWACVSPPVVPSACHDEESCRGAPSAQPLTFGPTPSATFSGAGNSVQTPSAVVAPRSLTLKQRLARALRACERTRARQKRTACERGARKRYRAKPARRTAGETSVSRKASR